MKPKELEVRSLLPSDPLSPLNPFFCSGLRPMHPRIIPDRPPLRRLPASLGKGAPSRLRALEVPPLLDHQSAQEPSTRRRLRLFHISPGRLGSLHLSGYFHRDMKPENVLAPTTDLFDYHLLPRRTPEYTLREGSRCHRARFRSCPKDKE